MIAIPKYRDIKKAHVRILRNIHKTPVHTSQSVNKITGAQIFFKCENFQKTGSFKFRGATHSVLSLSEEECAKGVCTHSSGNHAAALACAAKNRGIKAIIVMPDNAPAIKKKAVAGYGAEIIFCKPTLQARETTIREVIKKTGAREIHSYDYFNTICGQGTAAKEMIEEIGDMDIVMTPVGGGGLLSGTAITAKSLLPGVKVIAAEPLGADDAFRSFYSGKLIPSVQPQTICDGLLTSLGKRTFFTIQKYVDAIYAVDDALIISAMRTIWERMKIIVEPSSAVPLAVVFKNKTVFKNKKVGIILSGGNVDLQKNFFK